MATKAATATVDEDALMSDGQPYGKTYNAPRQTVQFRPAYQVRKLLGEVERTIYTRNEKTKRLDRTVVKEPAGFMLYGMKKQRGKTVNSIRVRSVQDLVRLGVSDNIPLINDQGEVVGSVEL